jgi:hypothetical protein
MTQSVVVANTAEAFAQLLDKVSGTADGARRIRHETTLSQRAFFWHGDDKVIVTPHPIPRELMAHNASLCGFTSVINLSPRQETVELSLAIAQDQTLLEHLKQTIRGPDPVQLSPYCVTVEFRHLLTHLTQAGFAVYAPEEPSGASHWIGKYLDSKLGFRTEMQKLASKMQGLLIPEWFAATSTREAATIAEWFYAQGRSAVIKVNFGESGWGLWVARSADFMNGKAVRRAFHAQTSADLVWQDTLLVVEEFIEPDPRAAGGSPSVELHIGSEGPRITYCCGQLLDAGGQFIGIEMGRGILPTHLRNTLTQLGMTVGDHYYALGYRGFCDIDFVASKKGGLYAVETNQRRTGGTHVYDLARCLFGDVWESDHYFLSHDSFRYGARKHTAEELLRILEPLLFPIQRQKRGVIITSINPSDPVMGYIIVESSKENGRALQKVLRAMFV